MRLTRIVLPALLVAALLTGCGGSAPTAATDPQGGRVDKGSPQANTKDVDAGKKFAADFLASVRDKKATPDQLTAEFAKVLGSPAAELTFLAGEVGADEVTAAGGADGAVFAVGKNKGGTRTLVRAVKVGAEWKADWLSVGPKGVGSAVLTGDDAPAQFAVQALLDAAFRTRYDHAAALLTDTARNTLGKSPFGGFDKGALESKLKELFGGADRYAVTGASKGTVTVDLPYAGGKKTATIKAVKGTRPGEWLVDSVEVK